jgi:hypothetical protein
MAFILAPCSVFQPFDQTAVPEGKLYDVSVACRVDRIPGGFRGQLCRAAGLGTNGHSTSSEGCNY